MKKALIVIIIMISLIAAIRKPLTVKMCQLANQALSHSEDLCAHFISLLALIDLGRMVAQ